MRTPLQLLICTRKASWQDGDEHLPLATERGKRIPGNKNVIISYKISSMETVPGGGRVPSARVRIDQLVLSFYTLFIYFDIQY